MIKPERALLAACIVVAVAVPALSAVYGGASNADDTYIYMRYAGNAVSGHGLTFNPGEPSYGFTSPAWLAVMLGPVMVWGNTIAVWKTASWICYTAFALWMMWFAYRQAGRSPAVVVFAVVVLMEPHLFRWSGTGMENALVAIAILALFLAWRAVVSGTSNGLFLGVFVGLLPFARPELVLLTLLVVFEWLLLLRTREDRRQFVRATVLACVVLVVGLAILHWATGFWLPQTAVAKALTTVQAPGYGARQGFSIIVSGAGPLVIAALVLMRRAPVRPFLRPALLFMLAVWAYLAWRNQLISSRYSTSLNLPMMVALMMSVATVEIPRFRLLVTAGAQVALAIATLIYTFPGTRTNEGEAIRLFAEDLVSLTTPQDRIAMTEIGAVSFHSGRYVIDLVGLTDPETVRWIRATGRAATQVQLERLLTHRRASFFIDSFAAAEPIRGVTVEFVPLSERRVARNNATSWNGGLWRLYRIEPLGTPHNGPR